MVLMRNGHPSHAMAIIFFSGFISRNSMEFLPIPRELLGRLEFHDPSLGLSVKRIEHISRSPKHKPKTNS